MQDPYIWCYSPNRSNFPYSFIEWQPCKCDREIPDLDRFDTSTIHFFFMISNLFVIFLVGLRCLDITNDIHHYSNHRVYRKKYNRLEKREEHNFDSDDDTDRWNEGIDAKFINRLLARLLVHWNYSWSDPVPASNRIISLLPYIKYDEHFHEDRCPICLGEYSEKPRRSLTKLRCEHVYHRRCITEWFMSASTCPNCRYEFPTDNRLYEEYKRLLDAQEDALES